MYEISPEYLESISLGYFTCHFKPGQCSKSSRTPCTLRFFRAVRVQTDCANYAKWDRLLTEISGGNGHSNYEGNSQPKRNSRESTISKGVGVNIYAGVSSDCIIDIASGAAAGIFGGPGAAVLGVVSNARNSCASSSNNNTNGGGGISPGQCTW